MYKLKLVIGHWLLVIGHWLLVIGYWSLEKLLPITQYPLPIPKSIHVPKPNI
ncbi:hypothetical protein [Trichormus sp. NMC-1]|uniref:hypothetical protein n=1 Tax=Trichormus sp. NMC-1 TaxID=1853259 RepID=UPI0015A51A8D|nr:hypothetical protein [Trichormus sp. NMC-1]